MKYREHIVIERPLEKVFLWMFQPHHIVQLVTKEHTQDIINKRPIPASMIERVATQQRFLEQAETEIEIDNLSTPMLQAGTTFQFVRGVRGEYIQGEKGEFRSWKPPMVNGTITIKKSAPSTSFSFTKTKGFLPSADYRLDFQAQQESTIIVYNQSIFFGEIQFRILSMASLTLIPVGNEEVRQQLLQIKTQMEVEID